MYFFLTLFFLLYKYRVVIISNLFGKKRKFFVQFSNKKSPVKTILQLTEALTLNKMIYSFQSGDVKLSKYV
jgi:hypothetical protein